MKLSKKTLNLFNSVLLILIILLLAVPCGHAWTHKGLHMTITVPDSCPNFMHWSGSMKCDSRHPEKPWHYFLFEATNPTDPTSIVTIVGIHMRSKTGKIIGHWLAIHYATIRGPDSIKSAYYVDKQFALIGMPSGKFEKAESWPDQKHFEKVFSAAIQKGRI